MDARYKATFGLDWEGDLYANMDGARQTILMHQRFTLEENRAAQEAYLRKVAAKLNTFESFPDPEATAILETAQATVREQANNERFFDSVVFPAEV